MRFADLSGILSSGKAQPTRSDEAKQDFGNILDNFLTKLTSAEIDEIIRTLTASAYRNFPKPVPMPEPKLPDGPKPVPMPRVVLPDWPKPVHMPRVILPDWPKPL